MTKMVSSPERSLMGRLSWFAMAGMAGFAVDAAVLTMLAHEGLNLLSARVLSFGCALVTTWLLNRSLAFSDRASLPSLIEFMQYAVASAFAGLVNLSIFAVLVMLGEPFAGNPVLAAALATAISMSINFWSYLKIVFAGKPK
jgi:putative flippase GtrA